jgi:hypothetical protein
MEPHLSRLDGTLAVMMTTAERVHTEDRRFHFDGAEFVLAPRSKDNVYGWLEAMFRFAAGKPFVYYSRYVPSARIFELARAHDVTLAWRPLALIQAAMLRRHARWRQLWLSESQWRALRKRLPEAQGSAAGSRTTRGNHAHLR